MLKQAIKKLEDEIKKNKDNPYIKFIGDYLIQYVKDNPDSVEKIMAEGKTLVGSFEDMKNKARSKAKNNCAVFTPEEGFKIVMDYYGIKAIIKNQGIPIQPVLDHQTKDDFDIDLDDLL